MVIDEVDEAWRGTEQRTKEPRRKVPEGFELRPRIPSQALPPLLPLDKQPMEKRRKGKENSKVKGGGGGFKGSK